MGPENAKVFSIYLLLFVYWSSTEKVKINVHPHFVDSLRELLGDSNFLLNNDAVRGIKSLYPILSFETKIGVKTLQLRENGEPLRKAQVPEIEVEEYEPIVASISHSKTLWMSRSCRSV